MRRNSFFSPSRVIVMASHTFTQLVRMKVFYFLAVFAVIVVGASYVEWPWSRTTEDSAEQELILLKSAAMGTMAIIGIFSTFLAAVVLLPSILALLERTGKQ